MFEDSFLVVGRTIQPIPFGSPDGSTTDLFFSSAARTTDSPARTGAHLHDLPSHQHAGEARDTTNPKAIYELLVKAEEEVVQQL